MNILVRAPQWLGDAVVSTSFLRRLKQRFPDGTITVACVPGLKDIFSSHPDVRDVFPLDYVAGQSVFSIGAHLKEKRFDRVYVLPRSFRSAFESWWARIPERVGFGGDGRAVFLTETHAYDPTLLYPRRYLSLINDTGASLETLSPHFPSREPSDPALLQLLKNAPRPFLGLGPASIAPARTWASDRFAAVAQQFLTTRNGTVILFGSPKEKSVGDRIASVLKGSVINAVGLLNLPALGWAVSHCDAMVVNDSGLMHVASAFQKPTVVLFGASDPAVALPAWGRYQSVQHREIACVPCLRNHCVRLGSGHNECLRAITVDEAIAALRVVAPQLL